MSKDAPEKAKPGATKPAKQASQLLFINKDPTNLERTAEEVYAIGSHVSKGSRKWKKPNPSLDLDDSTTRILTGTEPNQGSFTTSPTSSAGQGLKLRWRALDGRVTSTRTVGAADFAKPANKTMRTTTSPGSSTVATPTMSSFQAPNLGKNRDVKIQSLLEIYFKQIRPRVFAISKKWFWIEDIALVRSSPALTYSICAFASAFTEGSQHGLHKLCLPPEAQENREPLWPMPEWFLFQAQAISLLSQHLAVTVDPERPIQKAELHAILFLMRLQVMLGDQDASLMHMQAIQKATANAAILPDLSIDIAMWKVHIVLALKHPNAIRTRPHIPAANHTQQEPLLDIDLRQIMSAPERTRIFKMLLDRSILWRSPAPQAVPFADESLIQDHLTVDEGYHKLKEEDAQQIRCCLLICRYLLAYLRYIDADTSLGYIRQLVPELQTRLTRLLEEEKLAILWRRLPRTLVYLLYTGAFASRGVETNKSWFIGQLHKGMSLNVFTSYDDIKGVLDLFFCLETISPSLLEDVWKEIKPQAKTYPKK